MLKETLESIARLAVPRGVKVELVLVDNGSGDHTLEVMQQFRPAQMEVRILEEPEAGLAKARNTAIQAVQGDVILWTDDDVRLPRNWIERMSQPILDGTADAVQGGVVLARHLARCWMMPDHHALLAATPTIDAESPKRLVGANMALSRGVLEEIPTFDTELGPGALGFDDDTLMGRQICEAGFTIAYAKDATVAHHFDPARLSRKSFRMRAERQGQSEAYISYHWEHRVWPLLWLYIGWLIYCGALSLQRLWRFRETRRDEGMPMWEMRLIRRIHRIKQHLKERQRAPNYEPHGLAKKASEPSSKKASTLGERKAWRLLH